jgi:polypeptide N-acetylgalactosaminyltransferase
MKVSIIIPYRNEAWNHIQGTVASLLLYTPANLIAEIMFVSDGNEEESLYANEIRALSPLITMLVLPSSGVGLITAKMRAVAAASPEASVIMFLEPHTRVNRQWLQPLLHRIRKYPNVLAQPALDAIPPDNWSFYYSSHHGHWRFEWNLNLIFSNPSNKYPHVATPLPSPATSGGIFAIRKDWWNKLRFYDDGMIGWGGDHVEATMKVWRCGGHIEIIPCSRIGHLFREPSHRPYDVSVDQVVRNYLRMARVWFDDYLELFYKVKPEMRYVDVGNLTEQKILREDLQCKSMKWYVENVAKEMHWESDKICIPGCDRAIQGPQCCEGPAATQRSTIDRVMPPDEYTPLLLKTIQAAHDEL